MVSVSDQEFNNLVLKSRIPVLVDFWAEWCSPCKALIPILEKLAQQYEGKVLFVKANVDKCPVIAGQLRLQSIPHLLLVKNGDFVGQISGSRTQSEIQQLIEKVI